MDWLSHLVRFNHKKLTELVLKGITCKDLQTSSTFSVIIEDKGHSLQQVTYIKDDFCNLLYKKFYIMQLN
ncbi:hypothetical protein Hanom_Chr07g00674381 [Helianthus anomalus]